MRWPLVLGSLTALAAACGHAVGDPCNTNLDCSPLGTRYCDTSAPGGYCTVDGCDVGVCPDEAVCIRFFSPLLDERCMRNADPLQTGCRRDERCLCDMTDDQGNCSGHAHCAPEASEHRWCQRKCSKDADCGRAEYECRSTGTLGALPLPSPAGAPATSTPAKFCAPKG